MFIWAENFNDHWNQESLYFKVYLGVYDIFGTICLGALKNVKTLVLKIIIELRFEYRA